MAGPSASYWLRARLTLKKLSDGSTKTIDCLNRPDVTSTTAGEFPILLSVGDIGVSLDRFIPNTETGTIVFNDSMESYAVERKLSDLFQRYTIIDQDIELFSSATDITAKQAGSWTSFWKGRVVSWSRSDGEPATLSVQVEARIFKRRLVTREVTASDFPSAPLKSINQPIPLVVGSNVQVRPIQLSADGSSTSVDWAYGTKLYTTFYNSGVQTYYVKNRDGDYVTFSPTQASGNTPFKSSAASSGDATQDRLTAFAIGKGATNYIATGAYFYWYPHGGAFTDVPQFTIQLWDQDPQVAVPNQVIASATVQFASASYSTNQKVEVWFDKPVVLDGTREYYISSSVIPTVLGYNASKYWAMAKDSAWASHADDINVCFKVQSTDSLYQVNAAQDHWYTNTSYRTQWGIYCAYCTDNQNTSTSTDSNGLSHSYFTMTQQAATGSQTVPDLTTLDLVVEVNGLKDDGSGTITGVAGQLLDNSRDFLKCITREWNGSSFSASSDWDFSTYTSTYSNAFTSGTWLYRKLNGAFSERTYLEDAVSAICQNSACRTTHTVAGKIGLWAWSTYQSTPSATLMADDCVVTNIHQFDPSYVVNEIRYGYAKKLTYFNELAAAVTGVPANYTASVFKNTSNDTKAALLLGLSETIYGKRVTLDSTYDLISDSTSAEVVGYHILATFAHPPVYCDVNVPYDDYKSIETLKVIQVTHPALSSYFGSGYLPKKAVDINSTSQDFSGGNYTVRAETYRMIIEGRTVHFNDTQVPRITWNCRVLTNSGDIL